MGTLAIFALLLLLAVLLSDMAERTILSTSLLFLLGGLVVGRGMLGLISLRSDSPVVAMLAELALFSVLFTDGMRLGISDLLSAWFGPKGFASVTFGLMILKAAIPNANHLFHLVALVVFGSILAHSSTDVLIARWLRRAEAGGPDAPRPPSVAH